MSRRAVHAHVGALVLAATIIGSAMAFINDTITNVALRQTQARLGATAVDAQCRDARARTIRDV